MTDDTYKQQSDRTCASIQRTALSNQHTVPLQREEKAVSKDHPKGLLHMSHLSKSAHCACGNPAVQHVSSIRPLKLEISHLRKQFIFGSRNTALTNMLQTSCYYNFTAYCQSAIWPYINTAFDGSPGT